MSERVYYGICAKLTYLLKRGVIKEGLKVHVGGYVDLDELISVRLFHDVSKEQVLQVLANAKSNNGEKKFQIENKLGSTMVRCRQGRKFEASSHHKDSRVMRLVDLCLNLICSKIKEYDMEDFPDTYLLDKMFMRLKHERKLTNAALKSLISSNVECFNFHHILVTPKTIRLLCQRCPHLKSLNLRKCGYGVSDHTASVLAKGLPYIEDLNLSSCNLLSNATLEIFLKRKTPLKFLSISHCPKFTKSGIARFVKECKTLCTLVVHGFDFIDEDFCNEMQQQRPGDLVNIYYRDYDKEYIRKLCLTA